MCLYYFANLISRVICGAFNAQNGLIKNSLMDITNATNLPKAYAYLQISFMLAAIIGPIAGGMLSQPADRFPEIFGRSELLNTYPYLLSCTVSVVCASIAWLLSLPLQSAPHRSRHFHKIRISSYFNTKFLT
ncbi:hypothetical protein BDR04DRAFT_671802 [Suillus decipiens]|nr:hypothetical protein BDR04DRAFT_671802 [Suillus decipiens]